MVGPFLRADAVGMLRIEAEPVAAVLQGRVPLSLKITAELLKEFHGLEPDFAEWKDLRLIHNRRRSARTLEPILTIVLYLER